MESTIGLCKSELIDRQPSWTGRAAVERETAAWVHCSNTDRLHSAIGASPGVDGSNSATTQRRGTDRPTSRSVSLPSAVAVAREREDDRHAAEEPWHDDQHPGP